MTAQEGFPQKMTPLGDRMRGYKKGNGEKYPLPTIEEMRKNNERLDRLYRIERERSQ